MHTVSGLTHVLFIFLLITFLFSQQPRDESYRSAFKTYYMPPLDRKPGGYWETQFLTTVAIQQTCCTYSDLIWLDIVEQSYFATSKPAAFWWAMLTWCWTKECPIAIITRVNLYKSSFRQMKYNMIPKVYLTVISVSLINIAYYPLITQPFPN